MFSISLVTPVGRTPSPPLRLDALTCTNISSGFEIFGTGTSSVESFVESKVKFLKPRARMVVEGLEVDDAIFLHERVCLIGN